MRLEHTSGPKPGFNWVRVAAALKRHYLKSLTGRSTAKPVTLHQALQFLVVQVFHNFADVLRVLAGGDQQSVVGLHHN